ncbi:MAG: hypothetical protein DHS80DRAFT_25690 [Piptocephalis tieghemiana]|nr:MAG: hypothetical protein DHS80DRAFT_25690 [Piptocephalis tieghemiana]
MHPSPLSLLPLLLFFFLQQTVLSDQNLTTQLGQMEAGQEVFSTAALIRGGGLHGMAFFYRLPDDKSLRFFMTMEEGKEGLHSKNLLTPPLTLTNLTYAVHQRAVPSTGQCNDLGPIFDPFGIRKHRHPLPPVACTPADANRTCALGDLSGKYGRLIRAPPAGYHANGTDPDLTITGSYGVMGRSLVFSSPTGEILACGNITDSRKVDYAAASSSSSPPSSPSTSVFGIAGSILVARWTLALLPFT